MSIDSTDKTERKCPARGELYWADWTLGRGSEQTGTRPALVVQADAGNRSPKYTNTVVVALTSRFHDVPTHVKVDPTEGNGLPKLSYAMCEQLFTVSKDRLRDRLGQLDADSMAQVDRALKRVLALR